MTTRFCFYGRVSTEDLQDEDASRGWQLRAARKLIDGVGDIVAEYFDVGYSRSLPWHRRPEADRLLNDLQNPERGWEAVVIGEPHRAFYGNHYSLVFPRFVNTQVDLWVPGVGRVDPDSEAHDMLMSVFGGMAKGERNRIKLRVKTAMADMTEREGRFLGGRPPYGYRLGDAGPHPNPEKAAAGIRLHRLELDPATAPVVARIFEEYLAGAGLRAIARGLADDGIASPAAYDQERNRHRLGRGWAYTAVRAILTNERYTGRQVWGRQPRVERLLDPAAPQDGYITVQRWAPGPDWRRSAGIVHEPIVDEVTFSRVQTLMSKKGADRCRSSRSPRNGTPYLFAGRVLCGVCGRHMAGHRSGSRLGYRCRLRDDYALPEGDEHPLSVWLPERRLVVATFEWLDELFSPANREQVLAQIAAPSPEAQGEGGDASAELADIERRIERLVDAVENGVLGNDEVSR